MQPGLQRNWLRLGILGLSTVAAIVIADALAPSAVATGCGIVALGLVSVWLFQRRRKLRTAFLLPIIYIPVFAAAHFRAQSGVDAPEFTIAMLLFIVLCIIAALTDAFWSPYEDDLKGLEYEQRVRD